MSVSSWTREDSIKAKEIWDQYCRDRDLSSLQGRTAGIDPVSGRVWLGDSIADVVARRDADDIGNPLYFQRVGSDAYWRKGGRH